MAGGAGRERLKPDDEGGGLPRVYDPGLVENGIYERWLAADVFAPDGAGSRARPGASPFVIVQPPPNVTGALHVGHAFTADTEDVMVRHARMNGRPTLWLPGLDHASIAAQVVLDRILEREGETRASLGRERYLERMWAFVNETRETILRQSRRFGSSLDWERLRFTMDEVSATAVRTAFTRLYRDGLAYRTEALANWCVGCQTTVSDLEVVPTPDRAPSGRSAITSSTRPAARDPTARSRSPPPGRRRSSAIPPSPSIPTIRATPACPAAES